MREDLDIILLPVEVLIETEPVTREIISSVEVEGDYGDVVSVATSATLNHKSNGNL